LSATTVEVPSRECHDLDNPVVQHIVVNAGKFVRRLARNDAQPLLVGKGFDQARPCRIPRIGQCGTAEIDQGRDLLCRSGGSRFKFKRPEGLEPGDDTANEQH
jgi:hypothetical protein